MIVLDTNVLSELMRPAPEPAVVAWLMAQPSGTLFTTTVTQAEILLGIAILPAGRRQAGLDAAARAMFGEDFFGRVLPFDEAAAAMFAKLSAHRRQLGRPISGFDAQIAAIARCRDATLATRNIADFAECGLRLVNPWDESA